MAGHKQLLFHGEGKYISTNVFGAQFLSAELELEVAYVKCKQLAKLVQG